MENETNSRIAVQNRGRLLGPKRGLLLIGLALLLLAGCEQKTATPPAEATPNANPETVSRLPSSNPSNSSNPGGASSPSPQDDKVATNAAETQDDDATPKPSPSAKPQVDAKDNYNEDKPTLMGLSLHANKTAVIGKFGEPKSQSTLEDDSGSIQVFQYPDFLVGFKTNGTVEFIEVYSDRVDPGLKGLRVGGRTSDAIAALGKPNVNTAYVLTYVSQGSTLKLDIDTQLDKVLSIKLFASK